MDGKLFALEKWVMINSDNSVLPIRHEVVIWTQYVFSLRLFTITIEWKTYEFYKFKTIFMKSWLCCSNPSLDLDWYDSTVGRLPLWWIPITGRDAMMASWHGTRALFQYHDGVIIWKHFPRYWPFVWGIHRSPVKFPSQRPVTRNVDVFFDLPLN